MVSFTDGQSGWVSFTVSGSTPGSVGIGTASWQWQFRYADPYDWVNDGTSSNTLYIVLAPPQSPMEEPWVYYVLIKACNWASGKTSATTAMEAITTGTYSNLNVTYNGGITHTSGMTFHLTQFMSDAEGDCQDMSAYVHVLTRAIGASSSVRRITDPSSIEDDIYGGWPHDRFWYKPIDPIGNPSGAQYGPDGWTLDPEPPPPELGVPYWDYCWWYFHQVAYYSGGVYDATIRTNKSSPYVPTGMDINGDYKTEVLYYAIPEGQWDTGDPWSYQQVD